jgi:hypothetical protein
VPYNGSGTFTLPAGNPVVTGTTISSTVNNATNTDIANGLSNAVTRNGQSPPTADLPMGNFKLTGLGAGTTSGDSLAYGSTVTQKLQLTAANSTTTNGGQLYLNGATGNRIDFAATGVGAPTFTTKSLGTKIVLFPGITAAAVDYAMGIDSFTLWSSVPTSAAYSFKWYGGTTLAATLSGTGEFTPIKALRGCYGPGAHANSFSAGDGALDSNTTGSGTAVGKDALTANTTGLNNCAFGVLALAKNIDGNNNSAIGNLALYNNTSGEFNTAVGIGALVNNSSGSGNTSINPTNSSGAVNPVFDTSTENNRISMGSTGVTNAYVKVAWTVTSDVRDKTNFTPVPHGLAFVQQLQPTAYQYKEDRETDVATGCVRYGFKAQEVLALEGDNAVIIDNDDLNHLRINSDSLIPVLVNAIKELTARLEALEGKL